MPTPSLRFFIGIKKQSHTTAHVKQPPIRKHSRLRPIQKAQQCLVCVTKNNCFNSSMVQCSGSVIASTHLEYAFPWLHVCCKSQTSHSSEARDLCPTRFKCV